MRAPEFPGRVRKRRTLARIRNAATRVTGAACYGAFVSFAGFYGLLSCAAVTGITAAAAAVCLLVGRE